jgi:hypothetical protein
MWIKSGIVTALALVLGTAAAIAVPKHAVRHHTPVERHVPASAYVSFGSARSTASVQEPYGTFAQQQQCVANMKASLHGRSPLGSRDTAEYIQDRGYLDTLGVTEYDVMVDRCRSRFFHQYSRAHAG